MISPDLERRFGALRRLYGDEAYARLRAMRVAVAGLGGVGSWAAEALARSGVAHLTLIDLDHVAESNINRQVQALESSLGQSKATALAERIGQIHPGCQVQCVEEFVAADNWPQLLPAPVDALIDACDQTTAKVALSAWARTSGVAFVSCGAAGGRRDPTRIAVADLALVTHDPLLAEVRRRLRADHGAPAARGGSGTRAPVMGVRCAYSPEPVSRAEGCAIDGSLNCHGYGSSVMVTAALGLAAAAALIEDWLSQDRAA
jgi:tRNA A37 threonylcarbamoyladenosine dehydratase